VESTPTAGRAPESPSHAARRLWLRVETIHAVTYFGEETREAARDCGLRGFWMGYFAFRASPLGPVGPDVVDAAFYNFAPTMVRRAIPDAWQYVAPEELVARRSAAAAATLRRVATDGQLDAATTALPDLAGAAANANADGRPLYAANRALQLPDDPVAALWQSTTTLREQRGDAHVAALRTHAISGLQAHIIQAGAHGTDAGVLRDNRGWSATEWVDGERALVERGLLRTDGALTEAGRALHARVEADTDAGGTEPFAGPAGRRTMGDLSTALDPLATAVCRSGLIPYPNPMGLPSLE
jgi:hypothetical protein